jgi:phage terminase small subunit
VTISRGDGDVDWEHVDKIKADNLIPKRTRKSKPKLSDRQEKFVEEYAKSLIGSEAARKAGYSVKGANVTGSQLLTNPSIKERLRQKMEERIAAANISQESILREIAKIAFSDVKDISSWSDNRLEFMDSENIPNEVSAGIQTITTKSSEFGNDMSIKMHDKLKALEMLGKQAGLFASCKQLEANVTIAGRLGIEANVKAEIRKLEDFSDDELLKLVENGATLSKEK